MSEAQYERIEPPEPCVSPDGHDYQEVFSPSSPVPVRAICTHCGRAWGVAVFEP